MEEEPILQQRKGASAPPDAPSQACDTAPSKPATPLPARRLHDSKQAEAVSLCVRI